LDPRQLNYVYLPAENKDFIYDLSVNSRLN